MKKLHIAVLVTAGKTHSNRPDGSWAACIGTTQKMAIDRALAARDYYGSKGFGPYDILVGSVCTKVVTMQPYKLEKMK